ncbi:hypothetical protein HN51_017457 [Arachis hypogaea]|uniref:far upstream element-binding protein 2 n=1 Tax=Arachis ipaensis TaxID=130454 RepID=UPI0007AF8711|nr:far upstream element-binding protein 2 [Arachis ipaensis]XP_025660124.1 far upstream element-binding protein 2 [Arachis hypogaea]QHN88688.1 Far upstream element-binding protein [Arachis hypogaea]
MAEESQYETSTTPPSLKRKYDDQQPPPSARQSGFSSPDAPPPPSYNSVPPPAPSGIELAKQRAQEVAARLLSGAPPPAATGLDVKRPKVDNGTAPPSGFDSMGDVKAQYSVPTISPSAVSYGYQGASKKIDIPNGRVGVIIGKGGETIKYLQLQSGAKIQVTRDMDADPNLPTRTVELTGTSEAIATAEKLINEVLAEAESGGSGIVARRVAGQAGSDEFVMKIPNNKVGLIIGKGGETIKNMQASTGARIQVIPLHLPPGDTSTERTLKVEGTPEQIESAKQLVNQVISGENRLRNPAMSGGYAQQGYQSRPPSSWGPPGAPMQQAGYGYVQPGGYSGPTGQYNQQPYAGYPPASSGGYSTNWDQSSAPPAQQSTHGAGYDYYGQQQQNPGGAPPADGSGYNYSQPPSSGYSQPGHGYSQDGYGGYHAPPQSGYGQQPSYDQQQGYGSAPSYGSGSNTAQEGHAPNYGSHGDSTQVPPAQPSSTSQQGYGSGQQPSPNAANYPPQGSAQPGYGVPPTSQAGYGNPPPQSGYGGGYGPPPQSQKPGGTPPAQPLPYDQQEPGSQRAPPTGYGSAGQPGYGPPYGAPGGQPGYGQPPTSYSNSYASGYPQPLAYSGDGNAGAPAQAAQQGSVPKTSPES